MNIDRQLTEHDFSNALTRSTITTSTSQHSTLASPSCAFLGLILLRRKHQTIIAHNLHAHSSIPSLQVQHLTKLLPDMASSSLFDEHACYDLPTCLWRTNDPWSQAQIDSTDGYLKAATQTMPESLAELKEAVEQHLDWYSDVPSPFISTLSDQGHARDWATKRARRNERQPGYISDISPLLDTSPWLVTHLFEFETSSLNKYTWIFHLCSLINSFDIIVPQTLHATEDEYLISSFAPVKIALMSQFDCGQKYGEYSECSSCTCRHLELTGVV